MLVARQLESTLDRFNAIFVTRCHSFNIFDQIRHCDLTHFLLREAIEQLLHIISGLQFDPDRPCGHDA